MVTKHELQDWVREAIRDNGGSATIIAVAKHIWEKHKTELQDSGDLFFTWQYDMRWAANILRRRGVMKSVHSSPRGMWQLRER